MHEKIVLIIVKARCVHRFQRNKVSSCPNEHILYVYPPQERPETK